MKVGDTIKFTYKGGRKVIGTILSIQNNLLTAELKTDYLGKNEDWYIGESKSFNISEMKNIS